MSAEAVVQMHQEELARKQTKLPETQKLQADLEESEQIKISRTTFRSFRFDSDNKFTLPDDDKWIGYEYTHLQQQNSGCLNLRSREDIETKNYVRAFDKNFYNALNKNSLYSIDLTGIMQRQINDAMNCLW